MDHPRRSQDHRRRLVGGGYVLRFDGINDKVSCNSDSSLDDLGAGGKVFTIDACILSVDPTTTSRTVASKGYLGAGGWLLHLDNSHRPILRVDLATTDVSAAGPVTIRGDNTWHHVAAYYSDTTKKGRVSTDGVWGSLSSAGVGDYVTDAALNLLLGARYDSTWYWDRYIAWVRLSNNDRFNAAAGTGFAANLPARCVPPLVDANTVELWAFAEGAGSVAAAAVAAANNGTISGAAWEGCF